MEVEIGAIPHVICVHAGRAAPSAAASASSCAAAGPEAWWGTDTPWKDIGAQEVDVGRANNDGTGSFSSPGPLFFLATSISIFPKSYGI